MTRAGRLILPALRWQAATGFAHEREAIDRALEFGAGGFIIFGGTADAVRALTAELRTRAGRPLLFAADLERGAGQQFAGLTQLPPPAALASLGDPDTIGWAARTTAVEARSVGIQWILGPVADLDVEPRNPIVQTRAFGADPERVAADVVRWIEECTRGGGLTCAKHWPGHSRTTADSHDGVPVVPASELEIQRELAPFRAAVAARVSAVMTAHVAFPAIDPTGTPATFSSPILNKLRHGLGYNGAIVTDALMMGGATAAGPEDPAVRALAAGCDILLYPADPTASYRAIVAALERGDLTHARIEESVARYHRLLVSAPDVGTLPSIHPANDDHARKTALRTLIAPPEGAIRGRLTPPFELVVVDDDLGGRWPAGPTDGVEAELRTLDVPLAPGGARIVLAFAEPRASKGRAGFGPESLARLADVTGTASLVILFGHPRLAAEIPGAAPVLVAWHRERLMQEAAAWWLLERTR
ncbi:MAG TPA: glycoside hydrolase family 3 N-terminal domain-containing protein [Gemmatimonadales bacterium]|nr:glycoside hydrolase family 3 N-terminal domain-containing protein [Gemmatimonadales bacterium]